MNVFWTEFAAGQVELIYRNLLQYTQNETFAAKIYNSLIEEVDVLKSFPYVGQIEQDMSNLYSNAFRSLIVKSSYKVIYVIESNNVYIADIWDTRRDPNYLIQWYHRSI